MKLGWLGIIILVVIVYGLCWYTHQNRPSG